MSNTEPTIVLSVERLHPAEAQASLPARRDSDLVLAHWLQRERAAASGDAGPFLDFTFIDSEKWRHRFLITIDEDEGSVLLLWGYGVADLLGIPPGMRTYVPISGGIADRFRMVFVRACAAICARQVPIRVEAQVPRIDRGYELVRCCFIPLILGEPNPTRLAFGTIDHRLV
jgi:hypothetical protein